MILITGHKGYIGSHLTLPDSVGCDLKDGNDFSEIEDLEIPVLVHLAAYVSVSGSFACPDLYMQNNWLALKKFLNLNKVGKIVFASTCAVYGSKHQAREIDDRQQLCFSPYSLSKRRAERVIRHSPVQHVILRFANVYGGDCSVRGEASVHQAFATDNPIKLYGGTQTRDFIHIDTVIETITRAVEMNIRGTFNIGSGTETKIEDLANEYAKKRNVPIERLPPRKGEARYISLNCEKAKKAGLLDR